MLLTMIVPYIALPGGQGSAAPTTTSRSFLANVVHLPLMNAIQSFAAAVHQNVAQVIVGKPETSMR